MTVLINGVEYAARPLPAPEHAAQRLFRLRKPDGATYHVSQHAYGVECDCPDFVFHRDGLDPTGCKHIKALAACGMIAPPEPTADLLAPDTFNPPAPTLADLESDDLPFGPRLPDEPKPRPRPRRDRG
jgi:hypothetical protein